MAKSKLYSVAATLFFVVVSLSNAQTLSPYFISYPSPTPDGEYIIFSYETDLWKVPAAGGQASRITAMDGNETRPSVSPDGKWITFSSNQYGNSDVYIIPIDGGEIRQLTWHQAEDEVESWSWDSSTIYFTSSRENRFSTWSVETTGGTPKRLFNHYHVTDHNLVTHPNGSYLFNTSWESKNQAHRKRYRGPFAPQIESYDPETKSYNVLTSHDGKDMWPTVDQNGIIYFISDEANGEYNLYRLSDGNKEQITTFDSSIKNPRVSADGSVVVFTRDYQIWVYHTKSKEVKKLNFSVFGNSTLEKEQDFDVSGNISGMDLSPDKKKLAFVSRGELFISDADGKYVRQLRTQANGRVMEVNWLSDNKTILFSQTWNGYQNWFTIDAEKMTDEVQRTSDMQNNRSIALNSDRTKAVYLSGRNELRLMDLNNFSSSTVVEDEIWDIFSSAPSFSPDGRYILYAAFRHFEQNIFVHEIASKKNIQITDTYVSEASPSWSPDGKYIYFQTNRTQPAYPGGMRDADIYRIALDHVQTEFKSDRVSKLFVDESADKTSDEKKDDKKKVADNKSVESKNDVIINPVGLKDRWEQVGVSFGNQTSPYVFIEDNKTYVLYRSNHDEGQSSWWKTVYESFESPKTEVIKGTQMFSSGILEVDDTYWTILGGNIHKMNISGGTVEKIDIKQTFRRTIRDEFNQMFDELWANFEVNFYSDDFHGLDWKEVRERYREFLPHVRTRADLREMKNDMLGEVNSSHVGFSSSGDEEDIFHGSMTMSTGIIFDAENPYQVQRIVHGSPAFISKSKVESGDQLVRVNGKVVDKNHNREMYFSNPSLDSEINLTFERNGSTFDLKLEPTSYFSTRNLMYDEWMNDRQNIVDDQSDKRIAYIHMKNMGTGELDHFLLEMVSEGEARDGLILDLRFNTGGNVHDDVLRFLTQKPYINWGYRGGKLAPQSNFTPGVKPIVLLINEQSLSDAEMMAAGFRELELGTIMGMETYRWIIFTSGRGLVDGSFYRLPSWGIYTFNGENLEKTGVAPDIEIPNTFYDRINGRDPQLDGAIRHIMQQLEN